MNKLYKKEIDELYNKLINSEISHSEFEQNIESLEKKYEIIFQEKHIKFLKFSINFNIFAVLYFGFLLILNIFEDKSFVFIVNGVLAVFNSINLYLSIKKLNILKIKLIKACLI